jgi:hypothetical protein
VRIIGSGSFDLSKSPDAAAYDRTAGLREGALDLQRDVVAEYLLVGPCPNGRMTEKLALGVIDESVRRQRHHERIGVIVVMGYDMVEDHLSSLAKTRQACTPRVAICALVAA